MIKIEDTEIKVWDKLVDSNAQCSIKGTTFTCVRAETVSFHSDVYKYEDLSLVINRESRFGEHYYNLALYNIAEDKAWSLSTFQSKFDIFMKRLGKNQFIVWTDLANDEKDIKNCCFFTVHDNEKTDSVSVDYHRLKSINLLKNNNVLIAFSQKVGGTAGLEVNTINTLALYEPNGKLLKTFYEFTDTDKRAYLFTLNDEESNTLVVMGIDKKNNETKEKITYDLDTLEIIKKK